MEMLVVSQHRNHHHHQYYYNNRSKTQRFISSPSGGFRDINCRFQSSAGILPTPFNSCTTYYSKKTFSTSPNAQEQISPQIEKKGNLNAKARTQTPPIDIKGYREKLCEDDLCYSELWAGPTYSNSPPPSSLPIPKFSLRQKRSVSLDLPGTTEPGVKFPMHAKSAPCSPKREFLSTDFATKDLRRILHLDDVADE